MAKRGERFSYEFTRQERDGCPAKPTAPTFRDSAFPAQMRRIPSSSWRLSFFLIFFSCKAITWNFGILCEDGLKKSVKVGVRRGFSSVIGAEQEAISVACRERARFFRATVICLIYTVFNS
ncbi:unnamed protein product [Angiostrongylus costaricensis]|uniref:Uncharacterized protein n=1 Tax=Angiostrongylus costaricensis TaxID=334426 RepID=A0A0R3PRL5_ANGCS|nr:unnamed protein product [Angiostrongylus costaricensis]